MPSSRTLQRIQREYNAIMRVSSNEWSLRPKTDDLMIWEGNIHGLDDPRHRGKNYSLEIKFAENHPFAPPTVRFIQKVFCENVCQCGNVCMDILDEAWSPALSIDKIMFAVCSLLTDRPITGFPYKGYEIKSRRSELELLSS